MWGLTKLFQKRSDNGTTTSYCVRCRERRQVTKVKYVTQATSKGFSTRLVGVCQTCEGATSTFVTPV